MSDEITPNTTDVTSPSSQTSVDTPELIKRAEAAAERLEKANKIQEELLKRNEDLLARQILGGKSEAGILIKEKTEDEKQNEKIKKMFEGTGLDPLK
jgi:hypothetical protein